MPRCVRCGERIGAWEPAVFVRDEVVRRTSRAAELDLERAEAGSLLLHAACYDQP